jgi:hypothetical protein
MMHKVVKLEKIDFGIYEEPTKLAYLRRDLVDAYETFFVEAEALVADQPAALDRVQKARLPIDYVRWISATDPAEKTKYAKIVAEKMRRYKIGQVSEGRGTEEFLKSIGQ